MTASFGRWLSELHWDYGISFNLLILTFLIMWLSLESPGCLLNGLGVLFNEHSLIHYTCKIFISRISFHQVLLKRKWNSDGQILTGGTLYFVDLSHPLVSLSLFFSRCVCLSLPVCLFVYLSHIALPDQIDWEKNGHHITLMQPSKSVQLSIFTDHTRNSLRWSPPHEFVYPFAWSGNVLCVLAMINGVNPFLFTGRNV